MSYQTIHVRWKLELILLTSLLSFYTTLILSKSHFWKFSSISQNRNWEFMTSNPFGDSKYTWWTFCKKQLNRLTKPFKTFWQQMQKGDLHTRYLESDLKNGHCWEFCPMILYFKSILEFGERGQKSLVGRAATNNF